MIAIGMEGNPRTTRLWRFESPAQVAATDVTAPAEARVSVQPSGLLVVDDRLAAFGRAQGSYVLWRTEGPVSEPRSRSRSRRTSRSAESPRLDAVAVVQRVPL